MEIPKHQVLDLIKQHHGDDQAKQADGELPEKVDPSVTQASSRSSAWNRRT